MGERRVLRGVRSGGLGPGGGFSEGLGWDGGRMM